VILKDSLGMIAVFRVRGDERLRLLDCVESEGVGFAAVQSPFQDKGFHRFLERRENSNQMVVFPGEKALPRKGDFSKGAMI
jgi:hypothetical protein